MKNIYVLPTDKPSSLYSYNGELGLAKFIQYGSDSIVNQHIYITSDEEIKIGNWFLNTLNNKLDKCDDLIYEKNVNLSNWCKKIILTTDQDLIKDGVQVIDNEFLEWFVKNPSCEEVGIEVKETYDEQVVLVTLANRLAPTTIKSNIKRQYKVIIPKQELEQEQDRNKFSKEDMLLAFIAGVDKESYGGVNFDEWFEQLKK